MVNYNKCKFFCLDTEEELAEISSALTQLPTGSTYAAPGDYVFKGRPYDMSREGLYVFSFLENGAPGIYIKIIADGLSGTADIKKLMSSISWNHVHGTDDNGSGYQIMSNNGAHRKWRAQCGQIAGLAAWLVPQFGYQARVVNVSTNETLNNADDGHIIVETRPDSLSPWVMWDLTTGKYFTDINGDQLSVSGFISQIANGGDFPETHFLSFDDKTNSDTVSGIDMHWFLRMIQGTEDEQEQWYRRIFQKIV